jgi:hypothetical protein
VPQSQSLEDRKGIERNERRRADARAAAGAARSFRRWSGVRHGAQRGCVWRLLLLLHQPYVKSWMSNYATEHLALSISPAQFASVALCCSGSGDACPGTRSTQDTAGGIRTHTSLRTTAFEAVVSTVPPPPRGLAKSRRRAPAPAVRRPARAAPPRSPWARAHAQPAAARSSPPAARSAIRRRCPTP